MSQTGGKGSRCAATTPAQILPHYYTGTIVGRIRPGHEVSVLLQSGLRGALMGAAATSGGCDGTATASGCSCTRARRHLTQRRALEAIRMMRRGVSPRVVSAEIVGNRGRRRVTGAAFARALDLPSPWPCFTITAPSGVAAPDGDAACARRLAGAAGWASAATGPAGATGPPAPAGSLGGGTPGSARRGTTGASGATPRGNTGAWIGGTSAPSG